MVVQGRVAQQGLLQILSAVEVVRLEHVADAAIEALDHAIGFGRAGLGQAVLNTQLLAQLVKLVVPRGLALTRGKQAVRELLAAVGQEPGDLERSGLVQRLEEAAGAGRSPVFLDRHKHPARGPVNGHEQVAAPGLVSHLRQVFDIHCR